jgi:hypothetical protein
MIQSTNLQWDHTKYSLELTLESDYSGSVVINGRPHMEILATVNSIPVEFWFTVNEYVMNNLVM